MSYRVVDWALRDAPVTNKSDLLVLIAIAKHAHDDGGSSYPSVPTIAKLARLTPRGVRNSLRRLQASGVIAIEYQRGKGNVYRVLVTPERGAGVTPERGAATPERGSADPGISRPEPRNAVPPNLKKSHESEGESGVPPSESGGKVIQHPFAGRKPEPYFDRALR